jgi:hypothetical protein
MGGREFLISSIKMNDYCGWLASVSQPRFSFPPRFRFFASPRDLATGFADPWRTKKSSLPR